MFTHRTLATLLIGAALYLSPAAAPAQVVSGYFGANAAGPAAYWQAGGYYNSGVVSRSGYFAASQSSGPMMRLMPQPFAGRQWSYSTPNQWLVQSQMSVQARPGLGAWSYSTPNAWLYPQAGFVSQSSTGWSYSTPNVWLPSQSGAAVVRPRTR